MPKEYQAFDPFQTLTNEQQRVLLQGQRGLLELSPAAPGVLRVRAGRRRSLPSSVSVALATPAPLPPDYHLRCDPLGSIILERTS